MAALNPNGNPVRVGQLTLRTPGLAGEATALPPGAGAGTRSGQLTTPELEQALATSNVQVQHIIEISQTREVPAPAAPTRTTSFGEPALVLEVPNPGSDWGQVVLYTDEAGVVTWNFARTPDNVVDTTRGQATLTYVVPRYVAPSPPTVESRGVAGLLGSKVLKVLVFPLLEPAIGAVGDFFVARWEEKNRPYRVRSFTPANYQSGDVAPLDSAAWADLSKGPALLMVHGTASQTHTGFGQLPADYVAFLNDKYKGRVFAFDQITLSKDPLQNVEWLLTQVPGDAQLDLDIICHSRGGLVSRVLAERQAALSLGGRQIRVRNVVFVAAPNAGTILTDAKYLGDYIDAWTNLLNFFPTNGVVDVLQVLITLVKQVAVGAFNGLDGLESMLPKGKFLAGLNAGQKSTTNYFALASDYGPSNAGLQAWAKSRLLDSIFKEKNDLIVPTAGVYDQNGNQDFPITNRYVFAPTDGVSHSEYFGNSVAREKIAEWLFAEPAMPLARGPDTQVSK
jgi:hypothetical protein